MKSSEHSSFYRRHRFPPDVIAQAVWLYVSFLLSLRMVEDLLAERGITVSHQTVRTWAEKFGRHVAADIRRRSAGQFDDKWHLDDGAALQRMPASEKGCDHDPWQETLAVARG